MVAMRTPSRLIAFMSALIVLAACTETATESMQSSQWNLELIADTIHPRREDQTGTTGGVVIFDRKIREHQGVTAPLEAPYLVGRYYADLTEISAFEDVRTGGAEELDAELDADDLDILTEVIAKVEGDSFRMIASQRVIGTQIQFMGRIDGDSVIGRWSYPGHRTAAFSSGRFRMRRTELNELRDSAVARSRRGIRR
jgi:hypothetical protein